MTNQTISAQIDATQNFSAIDSSTNIQVNENLKSTVKTIYYIQMASCFPPLMLPLLIVSLVMTMTQKSAVKGTWLESHCKYQSSTSIRGLVYFVIGIFTLLFIIGFPILLIGIIMTLVRSLQGLQKLSELKTV